jgi:hypothetical protein
VRYSLPVHADGRAAAQPSKFVPIQSKLPLRSQVRALLLISLVFSLAQMLSIRLQSFSSADESQRRFAKSCK